MPKTTPTKKTAKKSATTIYQFEITLRDTKPKIWRRIQMSVGAHNRPVIGA